MSAFSLTSKYRPTGDQPEAIRQLVEGVRRGDRLQQIYDVITKNGFEERVLQEINNYVKDIQDGKEDFFRFNLSEHAR